MIAGLRETTKSAQTLFSKVVVCALFVLGIFVCAPHSTYAEYIESFNADIVVQKDASFHVVEKVEYVFTGDRHGIYRYIPTVHQDRSSSLLKERYVDIENIEVQMDSEGVPFTLDTSSEKITITIGDPDHTISGKHEYAISYTVRGAITYQEFGGAELYWNVTGNGWGVPMKSVAVKVTSPDQIMLSERACYQGKEKEIDSCEKIKEENGAVHFLGRPLGPNEGLTIAQSLDRTKIPLDVRERYNMIWILGTIFIVALCVFCIGIYRYKTKFKTERAIIPQYEPYPSVKPMYSGFLFDKRLDPRDITAGIVYLAKEGFLKIRKTERKVLFLFEVDDYEMTLLRPLSEITDAFEKGIAELIFRDTSEVGHSISLHELEESKRGQQNALKIQLLKAQLGKDLKVQGYFVGFDFTTLFSTPFIVLTFSMGILFFFISSLFVIFGIIFVVVLFAVLSEGRRTRKGYEALDHLKGFKQFLQVTESQRYIFHNAPEKNAEQFMEFLPYAIAFGVEKEWAKTFEGVTIPNPGWYDGGGSAQTFNAVALTQSLGGFSSSFGTSSGTSASSGGGSSGGGGGGGGGGSW